MPVEAPIRNNPSHPSQPPPQLHHGHAHIHGQFHGALPPGQLPPQLQQAFAQFHAVNQQLAAQLAAVGSNHGAQRTHVNHLNGQTAFPQAQVPQVTPQQQQARPATDQQDQNLAPQNDQQNVSLPIPLQGEAPTVISNEEPPQASASIPENHGTNTQTWQMVFQSGPMHINTPQNMPRGSPRQPSPAFHGHHMPAHNMNPALTQLQTNLLTIEFSTNGGSPPPDSVLDQARVMLLSIPNLSQDVQATLRLRIDNLAARARQMREALQSNLIREAQERAIIQRATQGSQSSAVYVLSSPAGPQALLVSPVGLYTTPYPLTTAGAVASNIHHASQVMLNPTSTPQGAVNRQEGHHNIAQMVQAQQQVPQQPDIAPAAPIAQQQHQPNQPGDLARILIPLGGHLWLIIRLFGFVYFFTAGAGWRRTFLLGVLAMAVFIAQTGFLRPMIQAIWDPVRRHAEGLVPLAGNERLRPAAGAAANNFNAVGNQPPRREPTPQEAAERLLQERERRDASVLRQGLRRVERAIALFVASLVPGVGERHIAAREVAEAARQAEIREREERNRREEEEARQRQEGNAVENAFSSRNEGVPDEQSASNAEQAQNLQPPLVEV